MRTRPLTRCPSSRHLWVVAALLVSLPAEGLGEDVATKAISALGTERNPKIRAQAALALRGEAGNPEAREALLQGLGDPSPMVRAAAANVLGQHADSRTYDALASAASDPDPLVARWAGWAVRRILSTVPKVKVRVKGLKSPVREKSDEIAKSYQEGVLTVLLEAGGFDVSNSMDFTDELEAGEGVAFFGLALPGVAVQAVQVALVGRVVTTGDRSAARAEAFLRVEVPGGATAWSVTAQAEGVEGPAPPPDPYADEYSIEKRGEDARLVAAAAVGREVGRQLVDAFRSSAESPVDGEKQRGPASRRSRR